MFLSFVQKSKLCLTSSKFKWLVIGNESADMDSVIGSLVYSYCKQKNLGNDFHVIPVCCISKDNMKLKKDVIKWLEIFGIDPFTEIVFLEDVQDILNGKHSEGHLQITLIDHHEPQLPNMLKYIREVIDHRTVVYFYPEKQLQVNNIELVGSCCTLIAAYISDRITPDDRCTLLKMLHGVVLLDTDCLTPNNGKTTPKDISIVETIEKFVGMTITTRSEIYHILSQTKLDVSGFSIAMMVDRDLKMFDFKWNSINIKMAIPTLVSIDVEDLLATDDLEVQLTEVLEKLKANVIICLTCGVSSRSRRGYLIFSKIGDLNEKISQYLLLPEHKLNLQSLVQREHVKSFYQNDLRVSRKMFIPIIYKFFNTIQTNNSNIEVNEEVHISIKTDEVDVVLEGDETAEADGAPYTLSTPLRSYSGSPDNRNSEMTLPSLNNRYTLQLVDQKRQKHHADMNEIDNTDGDVNVLDKVKSDDVSPRIFTPENSDEESTSYCGSDDNHDNVGPLPSFKHQLVKENIKTRRQKLPVEEFTDSDVKSKTIINKTQLLSTTASDLRSSELSDFGKDDVKDKEFISLTEKVNKKRQKLQSSHINSIASSLVTEVLSNSETIIIDEINIESFLDDWSECYSEEEKKKIFNCVKNNDMAQLAQLLTTGLINDCLNVPDSEWLPDIADINENNRDFDAKLQVYLDSDSFDDPDSLDLVLPSIENNYGDCHMGNIINEDNQCILSNNVNMSSADVVENISFNLYRRISSNQLNYSDDEKELLLSAGDWLPKEDVIYSDPEYEEQNDYSDRDDGTSDFILTKNIFLDKNICMDGSTNSL